MGYKKSFNLVTLQLIIPLSTMTKAEYKNAYGIDLDDIDIEKVTLLQDEGSKNKYFVDEIKTTENGIDIYAGGKVLSIGSSVSVIENAYSVANAKSIYFHPVRFKIVGNLGVNNPIRVNGGSITILNTNPVALDTSVKLKDYLYNAGDTIDIVCNVDFYDDVGGYKGQLLFIRANATEFVVGYTLDGVTVTSVQLALTELDVLSDEVNKIN